MTSPPLVRVRQSQTELYSFSSADPSAIIWQQPPPHLAANAGRPSRSPVLTNPRFSPTGQCRALTQAPPGYLSCSGQVKSTLAPKPKPGNERQRMVVEHGQIDWGDFGSAEVGGHQPAGQSPVVVMQADSINRSRSATTIVLAITSNLSAITWPGCGNVFEVAAGLPYAGNSCH